MESTRRTPNRYDHRLIQLVQGTRDPTLATRRGVPRSTAEGWARRAPRPIAAVVADDAGFNQISNRWQLDHVYRHDPVGIETLTLLGMLAANVGQTFYDRDLKPARRARTTRLHVVALIAAAEVRPLKSRNRTATILARGGGADRSARRAPHLKTTGRDLAMRRHNRFALLLALPALGVGYGPSTNADDPAPAPCPVLGWQENLGNFLKPDAALPTQDTPIGAPDCAFHQWSWEAFVWATALDNAEMPRFMSLPTPEDLLKEEPTAGKPHARGLKLAARSLMARGTPGHTEGAGAFVEADGNILVGPNGYPVYASVHMNPSYFETSKKNLIVNGGYLSQPADSFYDVGAAVFKATWMRLDPGEEAPQGTFTTEAEVPVLTMMMTPTVISIVPVPGQFKKAKVALVGLHVVGQTINHPEFLWGTFEHRLNSPSTPDNTFSPTGSDPKSYTFYKANTSFAKANQALTPPKLTFDPATQRFSPPTTAVLENRTGGENQPNGPENVAAVNASGQAFLSGCKPPQSVFANYVLDGTVWMPANTYNLTSNQENAEGSTTLANVTAETFIQEAKNSPMSGVNNCFTCHNATSYTFRTYPPPLTNRRIALSHVLGIGTIYAVPNMIGGCVPPPSSAPPAPTAKHARK